jgi:hypothetical protein
MLYENILRKCVKQLSKRVRVVDVGNLGCVHCPRGRSYAGWSLHVCHVQRSGITHNSRSRDISLVFTENV